MQPLHSKWRTETNKQKISGWRKAEICDTQLTSNSHFARHRTIPKTQLFDFWNSLGLWGAPRRPRVQIGRCDFVLGPQTLPWGTNIGRRRCGGRPKRSSWSQKHKIHRGLLDDTSVARCAPDLYEKSLDIPLFYRLGVMKWRFGTRAPTQKSSPVSQRFSSANSASSTWEVPHRYQFLVTVK